MFIINSDGIIEYANNSSLHYLQTNIEDVIGTSIHNYLGNLQDTESSPGKPPIDRNSDSYLENLDRLVSYDNETELLGMQDTIQVLISVSIVRGKAGCIQYGIIIAKDISYQKSFERELQLQQSFLISYDRMRTLNEMSIGLVHELGQPVTTLMLQLDQIAGFYIGNEKKFEPIRTKIEGMKSQLVKVSGFVERLRNYARSIDTVNQNSVDVNRVVDAAVAMVEYRYRDAGIELIVEKADPLAKVTANQPELEHALVNVLNNAREAYEEAGKLNDSVPKKVRLVTSTDEHNSIVICVYDQAGGISTSLQKRIFEPYFSTRDSAKHTGIGLSAARSSINSLGGDISVQTIKESGSLFIIRIPITEIEERKQLINLIEMLHQPYKINPNGNQEFESETESLGAL